MDRDPGMAPVRSQGGEIRAQDRLGAWTQDHDRQHVVQAPDLHAVGEEIPFEMRADRLFLARADLGPQAVLLRDEHGVREDAPLGVGEEAVGAGAGGEPLHVAGHVVVQEAKAVLAEQLQASAPGEVGDARGLLQRPELLLDRTVAQRHGKAVRLADLGSQAAMELVEGQRAHGRSLQCPP
jgi:hypothetical protein